MYHRLTSSSRIFFSGAWLAYAGLFQWTRPPTYIASKILAPLGAMIFFTFLGVSATGAGTADFYIIGNAMQVSAMSGIYGVTMSVGNERNFGTLIYVLGTPANRFVTFMGRSLFHIIDGMLTVILAFVWGVMLLGLDMSVANVPGLILTIIVTTASVCGMGLLFGTISLVSVNVMFLNNTVYFLLLLFSGANIPVASLPGWAQAISQVIPLTRGIAAARLSIRGASFNEIGGLLAAELVIGLAYAIIGYLLFAWVEAMAKRRGTLEAF